MEKIVDVVVFVLAIILLHLTNNHKGSTLSCSSVEYELLQNASEPHRPVLVRLCGSNSADFSKDGRWTLSKAVFADQNAINTERKTSMTEDETRRIAKSLSSKNSSEGVYRVDLTTPFHPPLSRGSFAWHTIKCLSRSYNITNANWQKIDPNSWIGTIMHMHCLQKLHNAWNVQTITSKHQALNKFLFKCANINNPNSTGVKCREISYLRLKQRQSTTKWSLIISEVNQHMVTLQSKIMTDLFHINPTISHEARVIIENPLLLCSVLFFFSMWPS